MKEIGCVASGTNEGERAMKMGLEVYMPPKRKDTLPDPVKIEYERYLDEHSKRIQAEANERAAVAIAASFVALWFLLSVVVLIWG